MIAIAILAVVAAAAVAYWLVQRRRPAPDRQPTRGRAPVPGRKTAATGQPASPRYGAVEIQARHAACEAALKLRGQRYLANEAPALPLAGCTAAQCSCAFVKLSDRRTEDRRLEHAGLSASLFLASNRRARVGRREGD
jgi:hypothetical protein